MSGPERRSKELSSAELSRLSERLGSLLQTGVAIAALFLLAGVLADCWESGSASVAPGSLGASRIPWGDLAGLGDVGLLIALGLVVLVATPVARVVLSLDAFAQAGERDYVAVLISVLLILLASVLVGALL